MASVEEVKKLASLARLKVSETELLAFVKEFERILAYMGEFEALDVHGANKPEPLISNVFREDGEPHPKGKYTDALVAQFPEREGNALKVKKIITHD